MVKLIFKNIKWFNSLLSKIGLGENKENAATYRTIQVNAHNHINNYISSANSETEKPIKYASNSIKTSKVKYFISI